MNYLFLDIESFFDREAGYDLSTLSMTEYIRDPRFKLHGYAYGHSPANRLWKTSIEPLKDEIDWSNTAIVAHNVKFDAAVLKWKYGISPALYVDTMGLAKAVLGPYLSGYSLDEVGRYLGLKPKGTILAAYSGKRNLTAEEERLLAEYCINDTEICHGIFQQLWPKFPENQRQALDWTIRTFVNPLLKLDVPMLHRMVENEKEKRQKAIDATGFDKSVLSSNKQFAELVQRTCGSVPTKISKRTGKKVPALSVADPGFLEIKEKHPVLYAGRVAAKSTIIETRGENLINVGKTGSWPFDVGFSGAVQTHRYSGGDGAGGNPQNFPKNSDIKRSIVANTEGSVCVVGDFSAIELRINAWAAKEDWLMQDLQNGVDVYSKFADKLNATRQFGKCSELGLGYGMGKQKFQNEVKVKTGEVISLDFAKDVVNLYRNTHPRIKNLWLLAENLLPIMVEGRRNRVFFAPFLEVERNAIVLPSGLKIMYPNLRRLTETVKIGDKVLREGSYVFDRYQKRYEASIQPLWGGTVVENICQALAGEICKEAIKEAQQVGLDVVGAVHDEIIVVCPAEEAENTANILRVIMETSPMWWTSLSLAAEVKIGDSWAAAK